MCWNVYLWLDSPSLSLVILHFFVCLYIAIFYFQLQQVMLQWNFLLAGNKISTQTGIGTGIAIAGVALYSYIKAKMEEEKRVSSMLIKVYDMTRVYTLSKSILFASFCFLNEVLLFGQRTKVAWRSMGWRWREAWNWEEDLVL